MKMHAKIQEGPEAFARFKNALRTVLTIPKSAVIEYEKRKNKKKKRAGRKS